ncbi:MAG: DNA repair protein RecO [Bacteroidetes bacterium]|nr:DNA repair protein RecO [Bacteroidota bacterium]
MLYKTKGIVLHSIKYSELSLIVKIYTEIYGLQSFIVRSGRSKKNKINASAFQPLTLLDFVAYHNKKNNLQNFKEVTGCYQFSEIPFDIKKSSIVLFIAEVLNKVIREEEQNLTLFNYIFNSVKYLDSCTGKVSDFHLIFLTELTKHIGFSPDINYENNSIFNLYEGRFQPQIPEHSYFIEKDLSKHFYSLLGASFDKMDIIGFSASTRRDLLNKILDYYKIHLNNFNDIKSLAVLEEIFK